MSQAGQILSEERVRQHKTVSEVVAATNIREEFIKAIEANRLEQLPGSDYAAYYIKDYAQYLGLDPHALLEPFKACNEKKVSDKIPLVMLSSFERRGRQKFKRWVWSIVSVITVLFIIGIANWKWADRPKPPVVVSNKKFPKMVVEEEPLSQTPEVKPEAAQSVETAQLDEVLIQLWVSKEPSWMEVKIDNEVIYQGILPPGSHKEWSAKEKVDLKVGNAGAVHIQVNNQDLGILGRDQEVVRRTFTTDSI